MAQLKEHLGRLAFILSGYRSMRQFIFNRPSGFIRPVIYHHIPNDALDAFAKQINFIQQQYNIITPAEFKQLLQGDLPINNGNVLITFDDGFKSQRMVAEKILNPLGIKAIFFVTLGLVACDTKAQQKQFIAQHIYRNPIDPALLPDDLQPMNWDDLHYLCETGHTIGAHTRTHAKLSAINDAKQLEDEIIVATDELAKKLGITIATFATPFGRVDDVNVKALTMAQQKFTYVFSGVRGNNKLGVNPAAIRREESALNYSLPYLQFIIEGGLDPYYYFMRKRLDAMVKL